MKYKIGTVARLLGVSPEALRLYERNGILKSSVKDAENGYRYYSRLDITALMRARAYHQYGFSMKETEALINSDDVSYIQEEYRSREDRLEEEIRQKQMILGCLRQISALLDRIPSELWTIRRETCPGIFRLEFMKGEELILSPAQQELFPQWVAMAPFAFPSQRNSWSSLRNGRDESYSALGVLEADAAAMNMPSALSAGSYFPPSSCLYTAVEISSENSSCAQYLSHLKDYVDRHGIEVAGDPVCRTFLSMNKRENYRRFRQIWLPIR